MGYGLSCCRSTSTFNGVVRVVHINGYVRDFSGPVTVAEVTGKPPSRLVCFSPAQLLSSFAGRPLGLDERLEPGRLYFLLPHSVLLQSADSSPLDLAVLATRLTALARGGGAVAANNNPPAHYSKLPYVDCSECNSAAAAGDDHIAADGAGMSYSKLRAAAPPWKPLLDTIEEYSFRWSAADERSTRGMSSRSDSAYMIDRAGSFRRGGGDRGGSVHDN